MGWVLDRSAEPPKDWGQVRNAEQRIESIPSYRIRMSYLNRIHLLVERLGRELLLRRGHRQVEKSARLTSILLDAPLQTSMVPCWTVHLDHI
jgi:hypothetical protein